MGLWQKNFLTLYNNVKDKATMSKVIVERIGEKFHFRGTNEAGYTAEMDAAPKIGADGKGVRPMEMLLMGMGGCSGIDIISILNKQKQKVEDLIIHIDGERQKDVVPALYENIEVNFIFKGELDIQKVKKAVALSMDKYCSVTKILEKSAKVNYVITVNDETYGK